MKTKPSMKTNPIIVPVITYLVITGILFACNNTKNKDRDETNVSELSADSSQSQDIGNAGQEINPGPVQTEPDRTYVADEEWQAFTRESNEKIIANERSIGKLKLKMEKADDKFKQKNQKKLADLEEKNKSLKKRLAEAEKNSSKKWQEFKREFNHDMEELGTALDDLFTDNEK